MRHREDQEQDGRPRVLLDVARYKGVDSLDDGYGITNEDLYNTAKKQNLTLSAATTSSCAPA